MLCVKTGRYGTALPVISQPITSVSLELCPELSYNDNLIYHYTSGIAFSALKQWNNAEEAFEICVTSPAVGYPAALQLEALKKLKLVQLISKGKVRISPPSSSVTTLMNIVSRRLPCPSIRRPYSSECTRTAHTIPFPACTRTSSIRCRT